MNYCPHCKHEIKPDYKICPNCGKSILLASEAQPSVQDKTTINIPSTINVNATDDQNTISVFPIPDITVQSNAYTPTANSTKPSTASTSKKNHMPLLIAIVLGIVAFLICLGVIIFAFLIPAITNDKDSNDTKNNKNSNRETQAETEIIDVNSEIIIEEDTISSPSKYDDAVALMENGAYAEALAAFEALDDYKDISDKINECNTAIMEPKYESAVTLMENKAYEEAISAFKELGGYKDSADKINECNTAIYDKKYANAVSLMNKGSYAEAIAAFEELSGYKDISNKVKECNAALLDKKYKNAVALMDKGSYTDAITAFEELDGYQDSADRISKCNTAVLDQKYSNAVSLMEKGSYNEAITAFKALDGYKESAEKIKKCAKAAKYNSQSATLKNLSVGDIIKFGVYEQDNNTDNGEEEIEWLVLEVSGGKALVVSNKAIDCQSTLR